MSVFPVELIHCLPERPETDDTRIVRGLAFQPARFLAEQVGEFQQRKFVRPGEGEDGDVAEGREQHRAAQRNFAFIEGHIILQSCLTQDFILGVEGLYNGSAPLPRAARAADKLRDE